jgi:hypothetical protein
VTTKRIGPSIRASLDRHPGGRLTMTKEHQMGRYAVLLPGDENAWEASSEEERQRVYGLHERFAALLEERGHQLTGGAELAPSRDARTLRRSADGATTVTDGPYAEAAEQLTGFYLVETDDPEGLLEVCEVLMDGEDVIEVRPVVGEA